MLNYLRQEIAKKEKEKQKAFYAQENTADEVDEAILECAHLFNEMEELTIVGTNVQRERPVIDIPIEDDVELDLIEMDVKTGRIVDVPMDVQTSEAFLVEKTYDDFYHEGMHKIPRFNRESQKSYEERIAEYASAKYEAYHDYIVQEGLFGNDMMSVSDERVPSNAMVDLGQLHEGSQKHFVTKLPVYFETTLDSKISLNQIHALNLAGNLEAFEHMGEALRGLLMRDGYRDILYRNEIWDIATPIRVIVPIVMDKYTVGVEFEVDGMRKPYPVMWSVETKLVRQSKGGKLENKEELMKKLEAGENNNYPNIKVSEKKIDEMQLVCKKDFKEKEKEKAIKEAYAFTPNRWTNQYYQEAIDFGGGGADPNAAGGAPADPNAGGAGAPPTIDGGGDPNAVAGGGDDMNPDFGADMGGGDPNADPNAATPDAGTNPDASTATTNDISQQIADNVANATAANTAAAGQADPMTQNPTFDANVDDTFAKLDDTTGGDMGGMDTPPPTDDTTGAGDDMNPDFGADMGDANMSDPTNPASSLDDIETDLNDNSSTDTSNNGGQEMGGADIENMSMDDMIQQGIEKIKSMPMGQLKEFLSDGSGAIGTSSTSDNDELSALESAVMNTNTDLEVIMESVIDPKKQVNICVRRVLGDLNNNKKGLSDIFKDTKKDAKHLNKAIHRAIKDVDVDKIAKKELENLSHSLNDMVLRLNDNPSRDEVEEIKSSIKNFTGATKRVSKVMDLSSPVQEAYMMEGAHGKVVRNTLWGWFIGQFGVRRVEQTKTGGGGKYHHKLHVPTFILFLCGLPLSSAIWNSVHANRQTKEEIGDVAVKTLTKDMAKISQTLFMPVDGSVEIVGMRKFRHAVDDLSDDCKYIIKKMDERAPSLKKALTELKASCDIVLEKINKGTGSDGAKYLQDLLDNMDKVSKMLYNTNKIIEENRTQKGVEEALALEKLSDEDWMNGGEE